MKKINTNEAAFIPFVNTINETEGLFRLINLLMGAARFLFKNKEGWISQKASDFLPANLAAIFAEIEERGLEPVGDHKQMQFLKDLITCLRDLPEVRVTLAFGPTNNFVVRLNKVISDAVGRKVILDIIINQYIIGGAIFEYQGKVSEHTLAERLDQVIGDLIKQAPAPKAESN